MSEHDPLLGSTFGRFRLTERIGGGTVGTVYLGIQPAIGKRVAVKVLHPELAENAGVIDRLFHEARLVNEIGHPHIIDVIDFGTSDDGAPYLVMELLQGQTLAALLQAGPLDEETARHIGAQIAGALGAAHAVQVVHRDLKPDNVFLTRQGDDPTFVKLLDFGVAERLDADWVDKTSTHAGLAVGTPLYMSPEQIAGDAVLPSSDVYSLGCVLYRMVAGRPPIEGLTMAAVFEGHLKDQPPLLRSLPSIVPMVSIDFEQIIQRCLRKEPRARFRDGSELAAALRDRSAASMVVERDFRTVPRLRQSAPAAGPKDPAFPLPVTPTVPEMVVTSTAVSLSTDPSNAPPTAPALPASTLSGEHPVTEDGPGDTQPMPTTAAGSRRWLLVASGLVGAAVLAAIALWMGRPAPSSGESETSSSPSTPSEAPDAATAPPAPPSTALPPEALPPPLPPRAAPVAAPAPSTEEPAELVLPPSIGPPEEPRQKQPASPRLRPATKRTEPWTPLAPPPGESWKPQRSEPRPDRR